MNNNIIILSGPTASGKSAIALDIAQTNDVVIINCDSKQIYKEIPIITAQPSKIEQNQAQHCLYGYIPVSDNYSVADWVMTAKTVIDETIAKGKTPLLVGGTGMYIKAIVEGFSQIPDIEPQIRKKVRILFQDIGAKDFYKLLLEKDPLKAHELKENDIIRVTRAMEVIEQTGKSISYWQSIKPIPLYPLQQFKVFFLNSDRNQVYHNCKIRLDNMLNDGLIDEIQKLNSMNLDPLLPSMKAHGIPEFISYLNNEIRLEEAIDKTILNTRHYIKRQYTWFRHQMPYSEAVTKENILNYFKLKS